MLSQDERNDPLLVRNLVHGMIMSAQAHLLIFETLSEEDNEMARLRSLSFNSVSKYRSLSDKQKRIVAVDVRDLFLCAWHGMVKMLDETVGCIQALGINISFHPSANFKVVKLIEALDDVMGTVIRSGDAHSQVVCSVRRSSRVVVPQLGEHRSSRSLDRMEAGG